MLTTKKVIEEAIKVREDEIEKILIQIKKDATSARMGFFERDINDFRSQIAELKQNLQDVFEAHNKRQSLV